MSDWATLNDRISGKWQLPLLGLSLVLFASVIYRVQPDPTGLPLADAQEYLDALVASGQHLSAIEYGDVLLAREEYSDPERAGIHLALGRARFGEAAERSAPTLDAGWQIVEHFRQAMLHAQPLTPYDYIRIGRAHEWQDQFEEALERFDRALEHGVERPLELRKHMIALRIDQLNPAPEHVERLLDGFLDEVGDRRLDLRLWGVERKLYLADDTDRLDKAATLLARNKEYFDTSDLKHRFHYLEAWLLFKNGHHNQAEAHLRSLQGRVERDDEVYAMAGWLLGRVVANDGGPQRPLEALSFYLDVLMHHSGGPYAVASRIGSAEALAMLERHGEAIDAYRIAIEDLESLRETGPVDRDVLRSSLGVTAEVQRQGGHLKAAVEYARLAVALVDRDNLEQTAAFLLQLAQTQFLLAEQLDEASAKLQEALERPIEAANAKARTMFAEAAASYVELAQLNALNERRASESSWRAAVLYARAGESDRAAILFQAFAVERPEDPLVPRALLRIGQLRQASGQLSAAVEGYRECYRRFPRTLDGTRALIPLAQCYLGLGPDKEGLAEKTLRVVLEGSEVFTPQAPEFAEALFLLGNVLNRRGDFERAIATLEEALERYPDDARVWRGRFLLAESYRQSGLGMKAEIAEAKFAGKIEQLRNEAVARLREAQTLYRKLIEEYEFEGPTTLDRLERVYLRHAYLYEADCYFETQDYRSALKLYEEAAGMYRNSTSGLAAYVQIINSHVFLGEPGEARAALARATVLVDAMPEEAFGGPVSEETKKDWKRYFKWLDQSELF